MTFDNPEPRLIQNKRNYGSWLGTHIPTMPFLDILVDPRKTNSERYRDLLQASTSIISISTGAKRVTAALGEVREVCVTPENLSVQAFPHQNLRKYGKDG